MRDLILIGLIIIGVLFGIGKVPSDFNEAQKIHQIEQYYSIAKEAVEECNKPHPDHVECKVIAL